MKNLVAAKVLLIISVFVLSCSGDGLEDDIIPPAFKQFQLRPDDIYVYNGGSEFGTRLDPLLNDSIKVEVDISYSSPASGVVTFIDNEGWFYKPNTDFFGQDSFTYTACYGKECQTAAITLYVEHPLDGYNCNSELTGETVTTLKDQPIEIRLFMNDMVCPFDGWSINSPEKGTYQTYSYSGGFKNTVYIYYPPAGFVGTDRFIYKVFTTGGTLQATCTINVIQ